MLWACYESKSTNPDMEIKPYPQARNPQSCRPWLETEWRCSSASFLHWWASTYRATGYYTHVLLRWWRWLLFWWQMCLCCKWPSLHRHLFMQVRLCKHLMMIRVSSSNKWIKHICHLFLKLHKKNYWPMVPVMLHTMMWSVVLEICYTFW